MLKLLSINMIVLFMIACSLPLFSQSPPVINQPIIQSPEIKQVFSDINDAIKTTDKNLKLLTENGKVLTKNVDALTEKINKLTINVNVLTDMAKGLINKDEIRKELQNKIDAQDQLIKKHSGDKNDLDKLVEGQSKSIKDYTKKLEILSVQNNEILKASQTTRLITLSFNKFEYNDWAWLVFFVIIIFLASLILVWFIKNAPAATRYIFFSFRNSFFHETHKSFPCINNKLAIFYDLIPIDFNNDSWNAIITKIKNARDGTLWCDDFRKEFYDLLHKNIHIKDNDLAFFLCNVWAKYVFQFEYDKEAWQWSSKTINDSLPPNLIIDFKIRLPDIGASHSVTARSGISVSITGLGPKITKIIHPGCEFINRNSLEKLCSMPASVEMGE